MEALRQSAAQPSAHLVSRGLKPGSLQKQAKAIQTTQPRDARRRAFACKNNGKHENKRPAPSLHSRAFGCPRLSTNHSISQPEGKLQQSRMLSYPRSAFLFCAGPLLLQDRQCAQRSSLSGSPRGSPEIMKALSPSRCCHVTAPFIQRTPSRGHLCPSASRCCSACDGCAWQERLLNTLHLDLALSEFAIHGSCSVEPQKIARPPGLRIC